MKNDEKNIDMRNIREAQDSMSRQNRCGQTEEKLQREKKHKRFLRSLGIAEMDEISRKKLGSPAFTARADSPAQAERLTALAEEALAAKGKVYVLRDKQKNCICWGIVTIVTDGTEGKKRRGHFELTAMEAAAGYEDRLDAFEKDIIMVIQERMLFTEGIQEAHINGYIYYPAMPSFWRMNGGNLWTAIAFGLLFGYAVDQAALGFAFFAMFLCCGSEERPRVRIGSGGAENQNAQEVSAAETD